jgi:hypothetical protein
MQKLNVPLGDHLWDDMRSLHVKFHEFIMSGKEDIDLSLFSSSEIFRLKE